MSVQKKLARHESVRSAPLLVARKDAAGMLGNVSVMTLIRMEARGELQAVHLNRSARAAKLGKVFYRYDDIVRLAQGV
jgi:hypothetical protein